MAVAQLNTSTLSAAIGAGDNEFTVGSTANITAGSTILVVRSEAMFVQAIPVSGRVQVLRGWGGTLARAHASGQRFFIGSPDAFKAIQESATALVGDSGTLPTYLLPGQRATDGQGNEYILVDATQTMYSGTTVCISVDGLYTAVPVHGGDSQGSVGLLVEEATSAQYAWAQVYGYNAYAQSKTATTGVTSTFGCTATTTVSTPDVGLVPLAAATTASQYYIQGMFIVGAGSSAVTSATSSTGYAVPVFLNYPYIYNRLTSEETSNS